MEGFVTLVFVFAGLYHLGNYLFKSPEQRAEERQMKNAAMKKGGGLLFKWLSKKI